MQMVGKGYGGIRTGIILTTSIGPLLIMLDLAAVVILQGSIEFGFSSFGSGFPSIIGILGILTWMTGVIMVLYRRFIRSGKRSSKAKVIFLKGRKGIRCPECGKWVNASHVGYQEIVTCDCGVNYNMFQEGPWDEEVTEEGSGPSRVHRKLKGNDRAPGKIAPPPRR